VISVKIDEVKPMNAKEPHDEKAGTISLAAEEAIQQILAGGPLS
jgi:hypothetical protein